MTTTPTHPTAAAVADRTLADLVGERPARAIVREGLGLDYCCHGERPLRDAADAAGIDPDRVVDALARSDAQASDARDDGAESLAPVELADHIVATHHRYLREQLPVLQGLAAKVRDVHGSRHPELRHVADVVEELAAELLPHLDVEERDLFPAVPRVIAGEQPADVLPTVAQLRDEHVVAGNLLAVLRGASAGYEVPADGCASYRLLYEGLTALEADTFRHIHLENNVLFPALARS